MQSAVTHAVSALPEHYQHMDKQKFDPERCAVAYQNHLLNRIPSVSINDKDKDANSASTTSTSSSSSVAPDIDGDRSIKSQSNNKDNENKSDNAPPEPKDLHKYSLRRKKRRNKSRQNKKSSPSKDNQKHVVVRSKSKDVYVCKDGIIGSEMYSEIQVHLDKNGIKTDEQVNTWKQSTLPPLVTRKRKPANDKLPYSSDGSLRYEYRSKLAALKSSGLPSIKRKRPKRHVKLPDNVVEEVMSNVYTHFEEAAHPPKNGKIIDALIHCLIENSDGVSLAQHHDISECVISYINVGRSLAYLVEPPIITDALIKYNNNTTESIKYIKKNMRRSNPNRLRLAGGNRDDMDCDKESSGNSSDDQESPPVHPPNNPHGSNANFRRVSSIADHDITSSSMANNDDDSEIREQVRLLTNGHIEVAEQLVNNNKYEFINDLLMAGAIIYITMINDQTVEEVYDTYTLVQKYDIDNPRSIKEAVIHSADQEYQQWNGISLNLNGSTDDDSIPMVQSPLPPINDNIPDEPMQNAKPLTPLQDMKRKATSASSAASKTIDSATKSIKKKAKKGKEQLINSASKLGSKCGISNFEDRLLDKLEKEDSDEVFQYDPLESDGIDETADSEESSNNKGEKIEPNRIPITENTTKFAPDGPFKSNYNKLEKMDVGTLSGMMKVIVQQIKNINAREERVKAGRYKSQKDLKQLEKECNDERISIGRAMMKCLPADLHHLINLANPHSLDMVISFYAHYAPS